MKVTNEEIRFKTNTADEITKQIKRRRWKLIGHVLRKIVKGKWKAGRAERNCRWRGRAKETWRRTVEREGGELGFKGWAEAGSCAKDMSRSLEREKARPYFPQEGKGQDDDDDDDDSTPQSFFFVSFSPDQIKPATYPLVFESFEPSQVSEPRM